MIFLNIYFCIYLNKMHRIKKLSLPLIAGLTYTSYKYYCSQTEQNERIQNKVVFKTREQHLTESVQNPNYDVVVIGGGCNGVGVVLDASTRGLRTLLIEKDDFGNGASSKSTKLIHGGVRYLQQAFDFSFEGIGPRLEKFNLVKEAIQERNLMIDSAPHLTRKIPFVIPCKNIFQSAYYFLGSLVYYMIYKFYAPQSKTSFTYPFFMNKVELKTAFNHLSDKYTRGVVYQDGSFNDARLLLAALLTATCGNNISMPKSFVPANAINRAEFIDFVKNQEGKITGVIFKDQLTGKQQKINTKYVVNCTGPWADQIRLKDNPKANKRIVAVGGSHLTFDSKITSDKFGICLPTPDGRILLTVPWLGRVIAGTTQKKFQQPTNNPICSEEQRDFINSVLIDLLGEIDINLFYNSQKSRWSGLRPLVSSDPQGDTKKIARNHVIEQAQSGLYSLMGGKWTIYRKMGEDMINKICDHQQKKNGNKYPKTQTKHLSLLGTHRKSNDELKKELRKNYQSLGQHLYNSYGTFSEQILKGQPKLLYGPYSKSQILWIVRNELVTKIEDIIMRRTRLSFVVGKDVTVKLIPMIGQIMAEELKWNKEQKDSNIREAIDNILSYEFD